MASRRIAASLHSFARIVEPKTEHAIRFPCDRTDPTQESPHFSLGKQENLGCPPSAQLPLLGRVQCWVERDQAREVGLRMAFEVIEPCFVPKRCPGSSRWRGCPAIGPRRLYLDSG